MQIPEDIAEPRLTGYDPALWMASETVGLRMKPGYRGILRKPDFVREVRLNGDGFHDHEFRERALGETRVAVLGRSIVAANQVMIEETWVNQLEKRLDERTPNRSIELMNFGTPGHNNINRLALLKEVVLPFEPDWVILHGSTDPLSQKYSGMQRLVEYRGYSLRYLSPSEIPLLERQVDAQLTSLQFLPGRYLYLSRLLSLLRGSESNLRNTIRLQDHHKDKVDGRPFLLEMRRLCQERGIRFLYLANGPIKHGRGIGWLREAGFQVVSDVDFIDPAQPELFWPNDPNHFTVRGNAAYAEALTPALAALLAGG